MILDDNGNRLTTASLTIPPNTNKAFTLQIECFDGFSLFATSPDADVVTWAKANPGDSFQNIQSSPIDLTPFAGTTRTFYFETRVANGAAFISELITIQVGRP